MRRIAVGWLVLLVCLSPVLIGYVLAGPGGVMAVMAVISGLLMLGLMTALAWVIGDAFIDSRR